MKLSASQAAKRTGKSIPTITRAIKKGRFSATKLEGGGYEIDPAELFRIFPPVSNDSDVSVTPLGSETPKEAEKLGLEVTHLRELLAEVKAERDNWRDQAQKITLLLEDHRQNAEQRKWGGIFREIRKFLVG